MNIKKNSMFLGVAAILTVSLFSLDRVEANEPGKKIYVKKCSMCHGHNGKGDTPMAKKMGGMTNLTVSKPKEELVEVTSKGRGKMPGYEKSLSQEEINNVVEYIQTFHSAK